MFIDVHCHLLNIKDLPAQAMVDTYLSDLALGEAVVKPLASRLLNRLEAAMKPESVSDTSALPLERPLLARFDEWIRILLMSPQEQAATLAHTYPEVSLFVILHVDLETGFSSVWDSAPSDALPMPLRLSTLEEVVKAGEGRFLSFVGFDPRRVDAFEMVEEAVLSRGFIGVKLYPPLGFAPSIDHGPTSAACRKLFTFCEKREVPLTTHCYCGGLVATQAGGGPAHPALWRPVLEAFPKLKVNFAHFGGENKLARLERDAFLSDGTSVPEERCQKKAGQEKNDGQSPCEGCQTLGKPLGDGSRRLVDCAVWAEEIALLTSRFEGVYMDTGDFASLTRQRPFKAAGHPVFTSRLTSHSDYFRELSRLRARCPELTHRLMYGSDWHLITRYPGQHEDDDYLKRMEDLFSSDEARYSSQDRRGFFAGNALRFLGLVPGQQNWRRVSSWMRRQKMARPIWMK